MKRSFRLRKSADFERVRRSGKSFAHPLIVLIVYENQGDNIRIGIAAGRSLGMAVQRNRAKRMIRASIQSLLNRIHPGHDLIWIARRPMLEADYQNLQDAMLTLLRLAHILKANDDGS